MGSGSCRNGGTGYAARAAVGGTGRRERAQQQRRRGRRQRQGRFDRKTEGPAAEVGGARAPAAEASGRQRRGGWVAAAAAAASEPRVEGARPLRRPFLGSSCHGAPRRPGAQSRHETGTATSMSGTFRCERRVLGRPTGARRPLTRTKRMMQISFRPRPRRAADCNRYNRGNGSNGDRVLAVAALSDECGRRSSTATPRTATSRARPGEPSEIHLCSTVSSCAFRPTVASPGASRRAATTSGHGPFPAMPDGGMLAAGAFRQ